MLKKDKEEAERISKELLKVHRGLLADDAPGLDPNRRSTWILARTIRLFQAKAAVEAVSPLERAQRQHLGTL
jgi:hypothetical protein